MLRYWHALAGPTTAAVVVVTGPASESGEYKGVNERACNLMAHIRAANHLECECCVSGQHGQGCHNDNRLRRSARAKHRLDVITWWWWWRTILAIPATAIDVLSVDLLRADTFQPSVHPFHANGVIDTTRHRN